MVGVCVFILKVKGSNLRYGVFVINSDKLTKYFPMEFFYSRCLFRLITWPMYLG